MKKYIAAFVFFGIFSMVNAKDIKLNFENGHSYSWQSVSKWSIDKNSKTISMVGGEKSLFGLFSVFNLYFTKGVDFKDGEIRVDFRANSGKIDQGGGIMWRVLDKDNYYIARFNPLEDNFTFYKVIGGSRIELKNADIKLPKGWHNMKIVQNGKHFKGYLDGKKLLECNDDSIRKSGGVGIWTKTDAKTSFKNFIVK